MKKYMIFGISIFICFITIFSLKINNKKFLENVCYIEYKMRHEKGIIEDEMTISDVDEFIKLVNNLDLKKEMKVILLKVG